MFELADPRSWPPEVCRILTREEGALAAFEVERRRIDEFMRTDVAARIHPPANPFASARKRTIAEIDGLLANEEILAWHCTRLLPHEGTAIQTEGLRLHDRELFQRRVTAALQCGALKRRVGEILLSGGQVEEVGRGLLHVVLTRDTLREEGDVKDLFENWGGEALYNNFGRVDAERPSSLAIGAPALVELAVPTRWLEGGWATLGERVVNRRLDSLGVQTEHGWKCEGKLKRALPASTIKRIVVAPDPTFDELTASRTWSSPLC